MPRRSRSIAIAACLLVGFVALSCDKNPTGPSVRVNPPTPSPPPPAGVTLVRVELPAPAEIAPGASVQLTANAVKSDNSVDDVTSQTQWTSSNTRVIQVSPAGVAKAIANGEAQIIARYQGRSAAAGIFVLPAGTFRLTGQVTENGFGIPGVTLTVVSGVGQGLIAVTGGSGDYALYGVAGRVRIQAKKAGYGNEIGEVDVQAHTTHPFEMAPDRPLSILSGTYTLTVEGVCSPNLLPDAAKRRTYTADLTQEGRRLTVTLTGATFIVTGGRGNHFGGYAEVNDRVTFVLGDASSPYYYYYGGYYCDGGCDLVERLGDNSALVVGGTVNARVTSSGIEGTMDGAVRLASDTTPPITQFSTHCLGWGERGHRFEMRRR